MADTPNLVFPLLAAAQSQKHVTVNDGLMMLDSLVQLSVLSKTTTAPPGSPATGDRYIVPAGATGAWSGHTNKVAAYVDGAWKMFTSKAGWQAWCTGDNKLYVYSGTTWDDIASAGGFTPASKLNDSTLALLGIKTTADTSNRLAVKSNGVLFANDDVTPGTGDMRVTMSKSAAAKDLGFTLQTAYSTRALFGLLADDNFTLKVSPNGSTFYSAISISKDNGHVGLNGFTADVNNALGVKGTNFLFDAETNHCRFTLNKTAAGNDASFTFQSNYSARVLLGLLGNDDFAFKLTPDGTNYFTGIRNHRLLHGRTSVKDAMRKSSAQWLPRPGAATLDVVGLSVTTTGTLNLTTPASGGLFPQSARVKYTSAGTAGASAGVNGAAAPYWRGNAADLGGFYVRMVGAIETFQATSRMFMGLYASTTAIGNVNPSTLLNMVGVGFDSGQTTLRLLTNDGTGAATAVDLGANFPTTAGWDMYELILSAEPNGSEIRYRVERLNSGHVAEGTITTDMPASTSFMAPHLWYNNGTTAAAVEVALLGFYGENASLLGSRGTIA